MKDALFYIWLQQAFLGVIEMWSRDNVLFDMITSGNVAYEFEPVIGLRYARVDNPKSGLWTLQLDPPKKCRIENHVISLNGVPGWYFLSPEKMWK